MKKKIVFITGTRADYGKLKSLMKAVESHDSFELFVFVCGMHLQRVFGGTYHEVLNDRYKNLYVAHGLVHSDHMSVNLGNTISHMTGYFETMRPDMIVVHGDRIDALAGAIVGALNNITVAHIEGGEVSGTIDESIRHAVSKFAHLHFVSNEESKKRIIQLGENAENIFDVGSPDIDVMLSENLPQLDEVKKHYGFSYDSYGIAMYHPVTTEHAEIGKNIKVLVDALIESERKFVVIYPNNDLGSEIILNEYKRFEGNENMVLYPSMRFEYFVTLLKNAECIIGNSSAGIRESGVYGIPAINVGTRQNGRYHLESFKNLQQVGENVEEILSALENVSKYQIVQMNFGKGDSTNKFMDIIANKKVWERTLQKKFIDM
jgi:UDP-N-acetylglucosamine 2-epimerase (hydrolysing)